MLKLFLLRHGETRFNLQEKVQGWNDSPLTQKGLYQAKCAGYGLKDTIFDIAYSGDTLRQIDTARTFLSENSVKTKIIPDYHFREMGYGRYEGGSYIDMLGPLFEEKHVPYSGYEGLYKFYNDIEIVTLLHKNDQSGKFEGISKATQRLKEGLQMIVENHDEGNILISTSSFAICLIINELFKDFKQPRLVDNASVTKIGYDGSFVLLDYNNITYRKAGEEHYKE